MRWLIQATNTRCCGCWWYFQLWASHVLVCGPHRSSFSCSGPRPRPWSSPPEHHSRPQRWRPCLCPLYSVLLQRVGLFNVFKTTKLISI